MRSKSHERLNPTTVSSAEPSICAALGLLCGTLQIRDAMATAGHAHLRLEPPVGKIRLLNLFGQQCPPHHGLNHSSGWTISRLKDGITRMAQPVIVLSEELSHRDVWHSAPLPAWTCGTQPIRGAIATAGHAHRRLKPSPGDLTSSAWRRDFSSVEARLPQPGDVTSPAWRRDFSSLETCLLQPGDVTSPAWRRDFTSLETQNVSAV
ncbi:unnamed protein product [Nesidiocoris tenuis]|uniref:Uncharacterized protein n=1 Tax=Nesidiocoris tenuis TaxID=355587 RepID=A0A6H5G238_9HEMI|nr:unnamed protein product [Nesidiocoris tenuis]